jgi:hypothetical protein
MVIALRRCNRQLSETLLCGLIKNEQLSFCRKKTARRLGSGEGRAVDPYGRCRGLGCGWNGIAPGSGMMTVPPLTCLISAAVSSRMALNSRFP